ncbi:MAG: universal stress protein [Desulfobacterales bacterium]|nr:MAG: universal stress protein [Desulfobacterales bacterium]
MQKIIVGFDGSDPSKEALKLGKEHARAFAAAVYILSSMEAGPDKPFKEVKTTEEALEKIKQQFESEGIGCETHVLITGLTPGEDLVQHSNEIQADEIIVGVTKRSKLDKLIFGSTVQYVILNASCPVVTVK